MRQSETPTGDGQGLVKTRGSYRPHPRYDAGSGSIHTGRSPESWPLFTREGDPR
jgi:hypothetical protein